ncbi:sarcoplasmic calcium-binding protein isoform X1 [Diprion similis]|uniref:sarcoplasmic calcium-binding protein isoform X1 n=1 Tax=Diprion similis TaxID=362088 RepID=UPI001EF8F7FE|nr:sarcoplasmic calcium-binding protein isoform X1 [Diprion similis]
MATAVFLRASLRLAMTRGVLENTVTPAMSTAFIGVRKPSFNLKEQPEMPQLTRRLYSKKIHTRPSTSIDYESDSDSDNDSDSERDRTQKLQGESAFWRRKMRTLHSHLDVNKDGVISYDDFMLLGERFADLGHLGPDAKKEFQKVLGEMWEEQWGEISPYNLVGVEKYLDEMHHVLNDKSLKCKCHNFLPYLFKAVDKDKSGEISVEEFKLFFQCLGLTSEDAAVSFSYIDTNEDGKLSRKEFVRLGRDFFLTEDHTKPSKHFWGPLVA